MTRIVVLISIFQLLLQGCSDGSDVFSPACSRAADEASRIDTARALLTLDAENYQERIRYWAPDVTYREPVLTSHGREAVGDYFAAMFSGSAYGFPLDRAVEIRDELYATVPDGGMTYMATLQWSGTAAGKFFLQTGMSIVKFRAGEGCPHFQRDYYSEGDTWWNIPDFKPDVDIFRHVYITVFGLSGRCFDEDGDGYTKYLAAQGCPREGLDCNDYLPAVHPMAMEIPGNGVDDDCDPLTPVAGGDPAVYQ